MPLFEKDCLELKKCFERMGGMDCRQNNAFNFCRIAAVQTGKKKTNKVSHGTLSYCVH
jgi:hypothetical protein